MTRIHLIDESTLQLFQSILKYFPLIGLSFDMLGAVLVLGPELPGMARVFTAYERFRLRRLSARIRNGDTITADERGFEDLRTAVGQGHKEGETDRPLSRETEESVTFFSNFDEIEGFEDYVEFRDADGNKRARISYDNLEGWTTRFTGIETTYFEVGAFALITGFFLQLIAEISRFSLGIAVIIFVLGALPILYYSIILPGDRNRDP